MIKDNLIKQLNNITSDTLKFMSNFKFVLRLNGLLSDSFVHDGENFVAPYKSSILILGSTVTFRKDVHYVYIYDYYDPTKNANYHFECVSQHFFGKYKGPWENLLW